MNTDILIIIAIFICAILFAGDPDLMDAIIKYIIASSDS